MHHTEPDNRNIHIASHALLFLRTPKVSSTSIYQLSADLLGMDTHRVGNIRELSLPSLPEHTLHRHHHVRKIAFVRNPWSRLVSCYEQKRQHQRAHFYRVNHFDPHQDFPSFVKQVCQRPDHLSDSHFRSQFTFISSINGAIIPDHIIGFSNVSTFVAKLLDELGIEGVSLPDLNPSSHQDYMNYYTDETKELVRARYETDIKLFGFEYGESEIADMTNRCMIAAEDSMVDILRYKSLRHFYLFYAKANTLRLCEGKSNA